MEGTTQSSASQGPALVHRPTPVPVTGGRIKLDVVVTGKQGGPVSGLDIKDFTLLDNKKAQAILSFHEVDGSRQTREEPSEVILVLDSVNSTFQQAAFARQQTAKFLKQNGGHLAYPTSIALFSTDGLRIQPQPSTNGSALAALIDQASGNVQAVGSAQGASGEVERFQLSVRTLAGIAENEAKKPGRKMLIWIGPGWPTFAGSNFASSQDRQRLFDVIVELSTRLREAHMVLYCISPLNTQDRGAALNMPLTGSASVPTLPMPASESPGAQRTTVGAGSNAEEPNYKEFVRGVKSAKQVNSGSLASQVLAVQSGGRVLNPNNDLSGQIADCLQDLSAFYTLSFDPPHADQADDYHEIKVLVNRAGLTVRTNSGYYNQP
jgi:VWFA-related protein